MFVAGDKVWERIVRFTPLSLFSNGEQGVWFDPSDLSSMYQDAAGTIPAVLGQPVGLMLDKSKGLALGPEKNQDLDFSDPSFWTDSSPTVSFEAGGVRFTEAHSAARAAVLLPPEEGRLVPGVWYECVIVITSITSGAIKSNRDFLDSISFSTPGTHRFYAMASSIRHPELRSVGTTNALVRSYSVRELPGNHARQATATARPPLMQSGAAPYLYRDPVDDALPWTAPAGSYDIVHIPLTGTATILTEQALSGSTNTLLAETTRAYLAIDRRLTAAEIDALAAYYGAST